MSLIERIKNNQLDKRLAMLQILAFVSVASFVMDAVLLYRHFTDNALTPALAYLLSLKLAFPPIFVLGATYLYAFLTGESVSEAPKSMWHYIRNSTLQSCMQLVILITLATSVSLLTLATLHYHTPPIYEKLVAQLLGGANDDNQVIKDEIVRLRNTAPVLADRLTIIAKVFDERRLWNNENKIPNTFLPRIFIRQLEADSDDATWESHPLRRFALAEANSMLAQALTSLHSKSAIHSINTSRELAITNYQLVISDGSNLSTELMKRSASQNIGNVYFYSGDCAKATSIYSNLSVAQLNAGTEGNRVAALVSCKRNDDAITVGNNAINRLQDIPEALKTIRDFVSLLTNTGFAKLINKNYPEALEDMQAAHDLIPDQMAKQNLALALIGLSHPQDALAVLEGDLDAPQVSPDSQLHVTVRNSGGSCTYLIRALALAKSDAPDPMIFANVLSYARKPQPPDIVVKNSITWKATAKRELQADQRPCGNLALLPLVSDLLR